MVRKTGLDTDAVSHSGVRAFAAEFRSAEAEVDATVNEEAHLLVAKIGIAGIGLDFAEVS